MSLERELHQLYERAQDGSWPGEQAAYSQFLRRKVRRGRTMAAGVALALAAVVGVAGMVPRILPTRRRFPPSPPAAPSSSSPTRVCGWWSRMGGRSARS